MPNVSEINQELVRAFNINLCKNDIAITNLTVQNLHRNFHKKEDHIVISFDKSMGADQCMKYLNNMKEKIVEEFCEDESSASMSFNISVFPFKFSKKQLNKDGKGRYNFSVPIDKGVIFNLKCCIAHVLAKDIKVNIGREFGIEYAEKNTGYVSFDRESYLYCMRFNDWKLKVRFINLLLPKIAEYGNAPRNYLEIIDNRVYIKKSIFDNVEFIKNIVKDKASLICRDFEIPSAEDEVVESLKFPIIDLLYEMGIPVNLILHTSYTGSGENSVLVPAAMKVISNIEYYEFLSKKETDYINNKFGMVVFNNVEDCTSPKHLPVSGNKGIYAIDFADVDISYCVLNKIIESSVINKDHELSIDPELRFRALSPSSPTPPPTPVLNGPSSGLTESSPTQQFPTRNQNVALKDSPRRESEKFSVVLPKNPLDIPGTSGGPLTRLGYSTVSKHIEPEKCVNAAQNVPAGTSAWDQPIGFLSLPVFYAQSSDISVPRFQPPTQLSSSGPSSWKVAVQNVSAALSQDPWSQQWQSSPEPGPSGLPWNKSGSAWTSAWSSLAPGAGFSSWKGAQAGANISEKEKELFEELLYVFNLNNQILECHYTNFIVKNGKIASLIHDSVDVKEYLQEVIDKTKEEYRVNKKEAYDLNEFPFKFLSNCEKNQETTVIANISSGALFNLKKLFIQEHEKKVEIEDININIVKNAVRSKKNEWADSQVQGHGVYPDAALKTCFPDRDKLEYIPIIKDEGGYCLDRDYSTKEVKSFLQERRCAKGTRNATTTFEKIEESKKDDSSSGYSSGFATDAENVSSKAKATTSSGYESMDCENTREGSPKRSLELSMESLAISTTLNAPQPSSAKKFRRNEV